MDNVTELQQKSDVSHKQSTVLSSKLSAGPHGLGDPDDLSLRKVERDILIPKIVRERSRKEKCVPEVEAFTQCCKDSNVFMVLTCRKQNSELKDCLARWFQDKNFYNECKDQYLKQRSEYRRTGEPQKVREFKARVRGGMF
ncbi:unnamed protein product [Trichogramma brassicae]|uniref:COX assembly mitochondrial protein n=1 Tax=Trichogramma brassicae TaxID=86971 RepID=A0A6H5J0D5_9HYME|nr:unnamed protein product [Trichogramma brassicae]